MSVKATCDTRFYCAGSVIFFKGFFDATNPDIVHKGYLLLRECREKKRMISMFAALNVAET